MDLTQGQQADLHWMRMLNDEFGTSLYWPTVRKIGSVPECEELIQRGLAERRAQPRDRVEEGYWITDEGRTALRRSKAGSIT